jgi:hypothetical protein
MNAKPKAAKTKKSQIKVQDMKPKKDAKGGAPSVSEIKITKGADTSSP